MTAFIRRVYNLLRRRTSQEQKRVELSERERARKVAQILLRDYDETMRILHDR